ncbi:MAG: class I SAM-dependent methyltransferase [Armatimonadetes bacterium]|nr:class I SAM-dependent methyltransferase [Armatimonadota bacterium]
MSRIVSAVEHYDLLAEEMAGSNHPKVPDPFDDPPRLRRWMSQADGPEFFSALGDVRGKTVMEIGIGTGRVARKVLDLGCAWLVGLDPSPKTLARARDNLHAYQNLELVRGGIETFVRPQAFDIAYGVWAFFHVENKPRALGNVVSSLKPGGCVVLSLERVTEWQDFGSRIVRQYPARTEECVAWLRELGCTVVDPVEVPDVETGEFLTTIVAAVKPQRTALGSRTVRRPRSQRPGFRD